MSRTGSKPFAAYLHSVRSHEIAVLRLGKKTDELYAYCEKLRKLRQPADYTRPADARRHSSTGGRNVAGVGRVAQA